MVKVTDEELIKVYNYTNLKGFVCTTGNEILAIKRAIPGSIITITYKEDKDAH